MPDTEVASGYAHLIDNSTQQTLAASLGNAAAAARADAARFEQRAEELRSEAAGLDDKPGMREAAEDFLREAAQAQQDAEDRLGMAGAYDNRAAEIGATATA